MGEDINWTDGKSRRSFLNYFPRETELGIINDLLFKRERDALRGQLADIQAKFSQLQAVSAWESKRHLSEADEARTALAKAEDELQSTRYDLNRYKANYRDAEESWAADRTAAAATVQYLDIRLSQLGAEQIKSAEIIESLSTQLRHASEIDQRRAHELIVIAEERDHAVAEILRQESRIQNSEARFAAREASLDEKSQRLIRLEADLKEKGQAHEARAKEWNLTVKPRLAAYEEHIALDLRASTLNELSVSLNRQSEDLRKLAVQLDQRGATERGLQEKSAALKALKQELQRTEAKLAAKKADLEFRQAGMEKLAASLQPVAERARTLDNEVKALADRASKLDLQEAERVKAYEISKAALLTSTKEAKLAADQARDLKLAMERRERTFKIMESDFTNMKGLPQSTNGVEAPRLTV